MSFFVVLSFNPSLYLNERQSSWTLFHCLDEILLLILSFVSMDFNPFILISLSNFGEVTNRGAITTPSTTNHIYILSHLCLAINVPSLYNRFAI